MAAAPVPPVAKKVPHAHVYHGKQFEDPYNWLRDDSKEKKGDDIMEHLKKESDFAKEKLKVESRSDCVSEGDLPWFFFPFPPAV